MGATGQGETQTAKTARNGERQKQAQAATGGGQAAKSTKEVPRQRDNFDTEYDTARQNPCGIT